MATSARATLERTHPELAAQWNHQRNGSLKPESVTYGSDKLVHWVCDKYPEHTWTARISLRSIGGTGCPSCAGRKADSTTSLQAKLPAVAKEWHPTFNGQLKPSDVTAGSKKRVAWRCASGHEWEAVVNSRTRAAATGCPYCSGHRLTAERSLAVVSPALAAEWHPTKNGSLQPSEVSFGNDLAAWWLCDRGHVWQAPVGNRSRGAGCPKCTNHTSRPELRIVAELELIFPDIVHRKRLPGRIECDILLPSVRIVIEFDGKRFHAGRKDVDANKTAKLEALGYRVIRLRDTSLGAVGTTISVDEDAGLKKSDLDSLVRLLRPALPQKAQAAVDRYLRSDAFVSEARYGSLVADLRLPARGTSLAEVAPHLISEWHPTMNGRLMPSNVTSGSAHKAHWVCSAVGHVFPGTVGGRVNGRGCPYCARKGSRFCAPEHSLAALHPLLASQFDIELNGVLSASSVHSRSGMKVWWRCSIDSSHSWHAVVQSRVAGSGCPYCGGKKVTPATSLAAVNPELACQWDAEKNGSLMPDQVVPGSQKRVWWRCEVDEGHSWVAPVKNRHRNGSGCPQCVGKRPRTWV